jgi:16S rRNA (guanine966-N2)-methyltransferase
MSKPRGLRVIAGSARGRKLVVPPGEQVRPTKDIVREAMFSALDARGVLVDAAVLDLYAGSGALAIEAISRGAARAVVVERGRAALDAIRANVATLGLAEQIEIVGADVGRFVRALPPPSAPFDLVCADPPYDAGDTDITALLVALEAPGWLTVDAVVTVERPVRHPIAVPAGWRTGWERTFGDTLLSFCWR